MTITPQDIQSKQFHVRMRGFDVDEVDKFLEMVAEEFLITTLENKQILEKIETLEKELANFRNKEQAFQTAILSAQKISDEMQAKSRKEAEELSTSSRAAAEELRSSAEHEVEELRKKVKADIDALIAQSRQEVNDMREAAEKEASELVNNAKKEHIDLINTINDMVVLRDRIKDDMRKLLNNYMARVEDEVPEELASQEALPQPTGFESLADTADSFELQSEVPVDDTIHEEVIDPDLESLYEKIELPDESPAEEEEKPAAAAQDAPMTLGIEDIEAIDSDEDGADTVDIPIPDLEGDEDMLFTLDDPLDELEPSIRINEDDKP
ncbi:MAG: DivIVA domain-containing protein [Thermodesulfobacteriota bacterium]